MTIQVAKTAGFCFGVRNALELVEKRAAEKLLVQGTVRPCRRMVSLFYYRLLQKRLPQHFGGSLLL